MALVGEPECTHCEWKVVRLGQIRTNPERHAAVTDRDVRIHPRKRAWAGIVPAGSDLPQVESAVGSELKDSLELETKSVDGVHAIIDKHALVRVRTGITAREMLMEHLAIALDDIQRDFAAEHGAAQRCTARKSGVVGGIKR